LGVAHPLDAHRKAAETDETPTFGSEITLSRAEVFDVAARCDEIVGHAEARGDLSIAFSVDSIRQFVLGRLMGEPGSLEGLPDGG